MTAARWAAGTAAPPSRCCCCRWGGQGPGWPQCAVRRLPTAAVHACANPRPAPATQARPPTAVRSSRASASKRKRSRIAPLPLPSRRRPLPCQPPPRGPAPRACSLTQTSSPLPAQDLAVVVLLMLIPLLAPSPDGSSGGMAKIAQALGARRTAAWRAAAQPTSPALASTRRAWVHSHRPGSNAACLPPPLSHRRPGGRQGRGLHRWHHRRRPPVPQAALQEDGQPGGQPSPCGSRAPPRSPVPGPYHACTACTAPGRGRCALACSGAGAAWNGREPWRLVGFAAPRRSLTATPPPPRSTTPRFLPPPPCWWCWAPLC
jgi:hypothetical protein